MAQPKQTPRRGGRESKLQRKPDHRTLRRRAWRVINATAYPESIRHGLNKALDNPAELRRQMEVIEEARAQANDITRGAHHFAARAYALALKFYFTHHDDRAALARFAGQMESEV
jgi:hypothetical protein